MKKGVVLSVAALVLLTGCASKVKCTDKDEESGAKYTYVGTFKKGNLQKISQSVTYKTKDEAKEVCDSAKKAYKDSDTTKVKCSGKKVTITSKRPKGNDEKVTKDDFKKAYCNN